MPTTVTVCFLTFTTIALQLSQQMTESFFLVAPVASPTFQGFFSQRDHKPQDQHRRPFLTHRSRSLSQASSSSSAAESEEDCFLSRIPPDLEGVPIPFVDTASSTSASNSPSSGSFIECYADSLATCFGKEYTIGVPCDYAVALCYYGEESSSLVPVELDDPLMDDVFPIAEAIVAEEFGEELVLQRTPQTLTLVGELEEDDEEEFEEDESLSVDDDDEEEEVEVLLSFEHRDREYNLVRLLDPILLVGRQDPENANRCLLLTSQESDAVMPVLEDLFLDFHMQDNPDAILP